MKLPSVTRGPVTLSDIDYSPRLSQETIAFAGKLCYEGIGCAGVRNDGRGGANFIEMWGEGRKIEEALEAYAKTLPPYKDQYVGDLSIDADFLVSLMVGEAIDAHEEERRSRKASEEWRRPQHRSASLPPRMGFPKKQPW